MARLTNPLNRNDHLIGPENASVHLVEYGDFECPYCGAAYPILEKIVHQMGDRLCFAFRQFPLTQVHKHAMTAAEVSEAAGAQGKFWQMHNLLFTHQDQLDFEDLRQLAESIDLDMARFDEEMQDHAYENKVRDDFLSGVRSGVNGTPTLFINGSRYDGPVKFEPLMQALEEAYQIA